MKAEFFELSKTYRNQGIFKSDTVILAEVAETGFDKVHANMAQLLQLVSDLMSKMERRIEQLEKHVSTQDT